MACTQKQKLINDLYTLRGGLSLILTEKDKIDKINSDFELQKHKIKQKNFKYDIELDKAYDELSDNELSQIRYSVGGIERDYNYEQFMQICEFESNKAINYFDINFVGFLIGILVPILLIGLAAYNLYVIASGITLIILGFNIGKIFLGIIALIAIIVTIILIWVSIDCELYSVSINSIIELINKRKKRKLFTKYLKITPKIRSQILIIEKNRINAISPFIDKALDIYDMLYDEYNTLIDNRDWQYLDLIVFYIQTGRADNIKEALQQVDRRIQTDTIIDAVNHATKEICNTIRVEIRNLKETIANRLDLIISQNSTLVAQNNVIITQNEIQNALIAKMAYSSQQIMVDVNLVTGN